MRILPKDRVESFLMETNREAKVYCPQRTESGDLLLMPFDEGTYTGELGKTVLSAKVVLFLICRRSLT